MRILIFSDTHGDINACIKTTQLLTKVDMILHLGDMKKDAFLLSKKFPNIKTEYVIGNNDYGLFDNYERIVEVCGKRIFLTHGHREGVKTSLNPLARKVKKYNADIGLFGHTHCPFYGVIDGVQLLNPGSASGIMASEPSCGVLEIEREIKGMIMRPI